MSTKNITYFKKKYIYLYYICYIVRVIEKYKNLNFICYIFGVIEKDKFSLFFF